MSTALVLHATPLVIVPAATPARPVLTRVAACEPKYVFGDSTAFSHETDVIQTIREVVTCGVALMRAHQAGVDSLDRVRVADRRKIEARARLVALGESVRRAIAADGMDHPAILRTAGRILHLTRTAIEGDGALVEAEVATETKRAHDAMETARTETVTAIERFAACHDMPGTGVALRVVAEGEGYEVEAIVTTPYGLSATFRCDVPESHPWRGLQRVRDLSEGTTIAIEHEVGVFRKRLEVRKAKLDRLVVLGASIESERGVLLLGEENESGMTHEIEIDGSRGIPRVRAREVGERVGDRDPYELSSDDAARVLRLYRAVVQGTRDLGSLRGKMTEATIDDKPVRTLEPATIAAKIVGAIAPLAREIARRSGAPGELVLRKNIGAGRRDEVYVTAAELLEPIRTLPPSLRDVFGPLALDDAPRSPRAPVPSMASYEEIHDSDLLQIPERDTPTLTAS